MSGSRFFRPVVFGLFVVLLDCAALDKVPAQACGNGVVDANEDCDTFPNDATDATKARCGGPTEGAFACHLRCGAQANGASVCPEGWGCTTTGICREPTGQFSSALGSVSGGAQRLFTGDFDGDGRKDLVAAGPRNSRSASRVRVHYFDDLGALAQVSSLPAAVVSPAVFDHDHNGRDDIAFGVPSSTGSSALGVVSGLADRTFLPVVFPAVSLDDMTAVPVFVFEHAPDVRLPNGNDTAVLLFARTSSSSAITSLDAEIGGNGRLNRALPAGPESIRGRPVARRLFDQDVTSACGEVVAALQVPPVGRLVVLSPCTTVLVKGVKATKWDQTAGAFKAFDLPALADGSRGALVVDVDNDGHLDVLVDTSDGPYVLFGDGLTLAAARKWAPAGLSSAPKMPLAAGNLGADGKTDYVFPNLIAMQQGPSGGDAGADAGAPAPLRDGTLVEQARATQPTQPWSDAAIGHFNGDAFFDVVLTHQGSPDLEVMAGGSAGFTPSTVTTDGIVQAITVGDFDGDHIDDIGFTQSTAVGGTSDLSIAYGRPSGGLEQPTRIGSVDKSLGLSANPHGSAPADLGTYSLITKKGHTLPTTALTLLLGSGDRQPLSLLVYLDPLSCSRTTPPCAVPRPPLAAGVTRQWSPLSVLAGPIVNRDLSSVLTYAVGTTVPARASAVDPLGVWVADGNVDAPGGLAAPLEQQVLDSQFDAYDDNARTAKIATTIRDLDNLPDGLSEILAMSNTTDGQGAVLVAVRPGRTPGNVTKVLPGLKVTPSAQLDAVDLDGDGFRDAVALFGAPPDGQLMVFLNDGQGGFIVPGIPLTLPPPAAGATDTGKPVAFAGIAVRGASPVSGARTQTHALAVLTAGSVVLATLRADKQGFDVTSLASVLGSRPITGATGIAAADFNGDGVEDLAIADGSIRLILQQPARSAP